jgi:hypothetical protein
MIERDIAAADRTPFFASFSKLHAGALITLQIGAQTEISDQPFRGLSVDGADVIVHTGDRADKPHHGHRALRVRRVWLEETGEGADAAVVMTSDDGTLTAVRFRSPMRADLLDSTVE